eukprot:10954376-Lingulodinium_polyedra.AAC.1
MVAASVAWACRSSESAAGGRLRRAVGVQGLGARFPSPAMLLMCSMAWSERPWCRLRCIA